MNEIFAELYAEGWVVNREIAGEIINRLEAMENYIPSSIQSRRDYAHVLLKEYQEYIETRSREGHK